jgi:polyhydroxyalkanoate synthesis regulator phasin
MVEKNQDEPEQADAPAADEGQERVARRLKEAWMKTVGAYATDERGAQSLFARLVGFGTLSAEEAKKVVAEARHRIEQNRRDLDARVDESIKRTVGRLVDPNSAELMKLRARLEEMEGRVKQLEQEDAPGAGPSAA